MSLANLKTPLTNTSQVRLAWANLYPYKTGHVTMKVRI
ncbi:unnamed protein product [Acidithrix sp. C25]|nr:unnamed protein product [Acidithrix sp. C25]